MDEEASVSKKAINRVRQVSRHLRHPVVVGLISDACDLDAARLEVDNEKHEVANQPAGGQHLNREEVGRRDRSPMSFQKRSPWDSLAALRCRLDSVLREDALHRVSPDVVAQVTKSAANPCIAPG